MATFIILANFTDQGIRNVKDSPARLEAFKQMAEKQGVAVRGAYYTVGAYDLVIIAEGNDEAVTTSLLKVGTLGNVRTQTLRSFSARDEKTRRQDLDPRIRSWAPRRRATWLVCGGRLGRSGAVRRLQIGLVCT